MMARLRGPPGHPPLLDQQDANGWTALMWCAHWGEDEHVAALLDAGADDSLRTTQPWFNMALEYPAGISALDIAHLDSEEYDSGAISRRIVCMLEAAAIGEWAQFKAQGMPSEMNDSGEESLLDS
jgi:ankyrin repeat protein